jgi:predicted GNAT family acetyltransferase
MDWKYEEGRIYSTAEDGDLLAEVNYNTVGSEEVNIYHTYVSNVLRGKGVASEMMKLLVNQLREKKLKATASCSYAYNWFLKNKGEYEDVISKNL